ncbi:MULTISPECIES: NAD-dependent epimerase/dehydratase family protein [Chryseobacterium]|uniref:NAD-dependent epimerase/dehydratase family protein n=1 Tax=Chryseobacterium TaxID=59732 RepID=UPI001920B29A|nr:MULTISPECIES: NAD(P)-dependent oxidoreductase [unclassified Chryseobacterium]MBL3547913.1 NAD(P)-dependent oxidoreductase [Chryseobacterium sp. KMC2]
MSNKILITGGSGKIGSHFIKSFSDQYEIRIFDLHPPKIQDASIEYFQGNLTDKESLIKACENVEVVIHLGGIANPDATFDDLLDANIIGTKNVIDAALAAGCKKIIYASSAQTIEGYPKDVQLNPEMPIKPGNLYGVSKCFGEALLSYHCFSSDLSAICLRIGAYEFPEDFTEMNARDLSAYLHPDDLNQLLHLCIESKNIKFEILNAISNNRYKRLDIQKTKLLTGYDPQYNSFDLFRLKK